MAECEVMTECEVCQTKMMVNRVLRSGWKIGLVLLVAIGLVIGGRAQAQFPRGFPPPPIPELPPFELDTGIPLAQIFIPYSLPVILQDVSPTLGDVTMIFRLGAVAITGLFDALAPYHPTAVGVYTRIERRPPEERTLRNMNIASIYAIYHGARGLMPHREDVWRSMLTDHGLDPEAGMDDLTTPAGIGAAAGKGAIAARLHDGMNQAEGYANSTGYAPVNTAYELVDASRWQPAIRRRGMGLHSVQQFVTPQMANVEPFSDFDPRDYRIAAPTASDPENWDAYKAQVDHVLEVSANLTDEDKMLAEFYDNKIVSFGWSLVQAVVNNRLSPMEFSQVDWLTQVAAFDAMIFTWQEKARYDAVRPFSAVAHVYGDEPVTAWGGPGMGTTEIPASSWESYINVADHPEYPSASMCACQAQAQAARRYFGTDELGLSVTYGAGSSRIEPGITPAEDVTLHFATWTEWEDECGRSRVLAGTHFQAAVDASAGVCRDFGDHVYEYFVTLMDGTAPERSSAQPLAPDPRRDDRADRPGAGDSVATALDLENCQVSPRVDLRLRDAPWGEALGTIPSGTEVAATARTESWFKVTHLEQDGWSAAWLVDSEGDCA